MFRSILFLNLVFHYQRFELVCCTDYLCFSIFQGISLALSIMSCSSAFSFYLPFSVSMNLGETVIYCGLEGVFLCGSIPV